MIEVTKLNGTRYYISPQQIELIETNPDVTICFVSGKRVIVKEGVETVQKKLINYYRLIHTPTPTVTGA